MSQHAMEGYHINKLETYKVHDVRQLWTVLNAVYEIGKIGKFTNTDTKRSIVICTKEQKKKNTWYKK
jgi:hypothetical protein